MVKLYAPAKLNLTLDITGREGGYHLLDSLVTTVDLFDVITARKRKDGLICVTMRGMGSETIPPERNNAVRAGEEFVRTFATSGADITISKNIPIGAGMGGSSADAAGVLNALARLYETEDNSALKRLADELGSDTGYLLTGGLQRMRGRGERLNPVPFGGTLHVLVLVPGSGVSTAECYRTFDEQGAAPPSPRTERAIEALSAGDPAWAARLFSNDLFDSAVRLNSDVGTAFRELKAFSPLGVSMTGSGSAVFALFGTRELCEWARSRYRGKFRAYVLKSVGAADA